MTAITAITGVAAGGVGVGGGVLAPRSRSGVPAQPDLDLGPGPGRAPYRSERGLRARSRPGDGAPAVRHDEAAAVGVECGPEAGHEHRAGAQLVEGDRNRTRRWPTTSPPGEWSPGRRG